MTRPLPDDPELARRVAAWVADAVGAGATVRRAHRLPGASTSAVHAVDVETATGHVERLVLRRYVDPAVLRSEPNAVQREVLVLGALEGIPLAVPRLVAADPLGEHCGAPSLLMTRVPGRPPRRAPSDLDGYVTRLAAPLPAIHDVTVPANPEFPAYHRYHRGTEPPVPSWSLQRRAWTVAIEHHRAAHPAPADGCFIHRDYHSGNVLWRDGAVSGVVDWAWACAGPREIDVAHCRVNLAIAIDTAVADDFLDAWRSAAGGKAYDPTWDLVDAVDLVPHLPGTPEARRRLDALVARAAAELA